jgi:hypothetical protein
LGSALEAVLTAALIRDLERGGGRLSASGVDGAPPRLAPDWKGLGAEEPMTDVSEAARKAWADALEEA